MSRRKVLGETHHLALRLPKFCTKPLKTPLPMITFRTPNGFGASLSNDCAPTVAFQFQSIAPLTIRTVPGDL